MLLVANELTHITTIYDYILRFSILNFCTKNKVDVNIIITFYHVEIMTSSHNKDINKIDEDISINHNVVM